MISLVCHADTPASSVGAVSVDIVSSEGRMTLRFAVEPSASLARPTQQTAARTDELWRTTCFEMFVKPDGSAGYFEFNFSPSTQWAAYRFDEYRAGMADLNVPAPVIEPDDEGVRVSVDLSSLPPPPWQISLSAVIEEPDGTKSYWALRHPPGKPDFHHPDCFALRIPALA